MILVDITSYLNPQPKTHTHIHSYRNIIQVPMLLMQVKTQHGCVDAGIVGLPSAWPGGQGSLLRCSPAQARFCKLLRCVLAGYCIVLLTNSHSLCICIIHEVVSPSSGRLVLAFESRRLMWANVGHPSLQNVHLNVPDVMAQSIWAHGTATTCALRSSFGLLA